MFHGVSHLDIPVTDLKRSVEFYSACTGFPVRAQGQGWCDLDTHSVLLRLLEVKKVEHRTALRLQVADVQKAFEALAAAGGRPLYEPMRTPQLELVGSLQDFDGHTLSVWRPLSEDEYGFLPELPKEQAWEGEAEALLKSLLTGVPSLFRGLARRKVVREAEGLAEGRDVGREDVIRGYIRASAKVTRHRVKGPLQQHGIDPDAYREDFEW